MNQSNRMSTIQRLVDGELETSARDQILREAEQDHAIYRDLALAFIETQTLNQSLSEWLPRPTTATPEQVQQDHTATSHAPQSPNGTDRVTAINGDGASEKHLHRPVNGFRNRLRGDRWFSPASSASPREMTKSSDGASNTTSVSRPTSNRMHSPGRTWLAVIAASMLLAMISASSGWWLGRAQHNDGHNIGTMSARDTERESVAGTDESSTQSEHSNAPGGDAQRDAHPINDSNDQNNASGVPRNHEGLSPGHRRLLDSLPEEFRMHALRNGFVIDEQRQVLSVEMDDGRTVNVPVRKIKVNYLGDRIYQ